MTELDDTLDLPAAELHRDPRPTPLSPLLYEPLVRANRLALLAALADQMNRVADLSRLST